MKLWLLPAVRVSACAVLKHLIPVDLVSHTVYKYILAILVDPSAIQTLTPYVIAFTGIIPTFTS